MKQECQHEYERRFRYQPDREVLSDVFKGWQKAEVIECASEIRSPRESASHLCQ
jgi:hypothetical protein